MVEKKVIQKYQKRLICVECKKPISHKNGTYVLLGTYNHPSRNTEELYYHFPCFVEWHGKKVNEKAMGLLGQQGDIKFKDINSLLNDPALQQLAKNAMDVFFGEELNNSDISKKTKKRKPRKKKM